MPPIRCPFCNAQGLDRLKIEQTASFQVVYCGQCGAIHGVLPLAAASPIEAQNDPPRQAEIVLAEPPEPARPQPPQVEAPKHPPEQYQAEKPLDRRPIAPIEAPKRTQRQTEKSLTKDRIGLMAVSKGFYGMAFDPPLCPKCKIDMVEEKVPDGHKEAGQSFWKCPNFKTCKQWLPIKD